MPLIRDTEIVKKATRRILDKTQFYGKYELQSCPFCGKAKVGVEPCVYDEAKYVTRCLECFASTDQFDTPDEAADAWNNDIFSEITKMTNKTTPYISDPDTWGDLKNAIVRNAFAEYKTKLRSALRVWNQPSKYEKRMKEAEIDESWFYSKHYRSLTNIDGASTVDAAHKQARYEVLFRIPNHCDRCGNRDCPNVKDIWWLWDRNNVYDICKGFKKKKPWEA